MEDEAVSRRSLLRGTAALCGASMLTAQPDPPKLKVAIFSKHLMFLKDQQLAKGAAALGFDGIDLTVRKGGHVEPARVRQDLPTLVKILRDHGLEVPMITTDIVDAETPYVTDILAVMAELHIRHYRWGGMKYTKDPSMANQIEALKPRAAKLAALNAQYQVGAMYHTHSGIDLVGASIWDLHEILAGLDPSAVGINYDIGHATIEGGFGGWINSFRITGPYLRGIAVKDFLWEKNRAGEWVAAWKPIGQGMVHWGEFFRMVAEAKFSGPLQLHFEYPLGGAEDGRSQLTMNENEVLPAMKRDLQQLRVYLRAG